MFVFIWSLLASLATLVLGFQTNRNKLCLYILYALFRLSISTPIFLTISHANLLLVDTLTTTAPMFTQHKN